MKLTSVQKRIFNESDQRLRELERQWKESGSQSDYRRWIKEKERTGQLEYKIVKSPQGNSYSLVPEHNDQEIGAIPILTGIPEQATNQKLIHKILTSLARGACPAACYGTPGCKFCQIINQAREIHREVRNGINPDWAQITHVPTWNELLAELYPSDKPDDLL